MKAFLFAAGFGRRMGSLTEQCPKPLLPVGGIPMIAYSLFALYLWQVESVIINLHYRGETIREYLAGFPYFPIHFSEEKKILETAGGIRQAIGTFFSQKEKIIILNSDVILLPKPLDSPQLHYLQAASACLFLQPKSSPKSPQKNEISFCYVKDKTNTCDAQNISMLSSFDSGAYYYIGYGLLSLGSLLSLETGVSKKLSAVWREDSAKKQLKGRPFEGKIWHGGDAAAYQKTNQFFYKNRTDILKQSGLLQKWTSFLEAWPQKEA